MVRLRPSCLQTVTVRLTLFGQSYFMAAVQPALIHKQSQYSSLVWTVLVQFVCVLASVNTVTVLLTYPVFKQ